LKHLQELAAQAKNADELATISERIAEKEQLLNELQYALKTYKDGERGIGDL